MVRLAHLKMDPVRVAEWICRELGPDATRVLRDALDKAMTNPTEDNPFREE
jgi:hypothetical protein